MNIFYLDHSPQKSAAYHCDKHAVKMILEYAQLLSTSHRVLDGTPTVGLSKTGRKQTRYTLTNSLEHHLYSATHINHPSAVWARQSQANYNHLVELMKCLCVEYTDRYGKHHKCEELLDALSTAPSMINTTNKFTEPPPAMPDYCKVAGNSVQSYRNYYIKEKSQFAKWKTGKQPAWYIEGVSSSANV